MHLLHQYCISITPILFHVIWIIIIFRYVFYLLTESEISYIYLIADIIFSSRFLLIQQFTKIITTSPKQPLEMSRFLFSDRQHPATMHSTQL